MKTPLPRRLALAALLVLAAGCAETTPPPAPMAGPPPPPPEQPAMPETSVNYTDTQMPGETPAVRMKLLRETPMPPNKILVVEVGGRVPRPRVILVDSPPPPLKNEEVPHRSGPHEEWLPGHWRYYGGHYVWISGRWEQPPRPHARYVAPRWEAQGSGYVFIEGYWQVR